MEKKMETNIHYSILGLYWGYIGIMEKMEATGCIRKKNMGENGFRVYGEGWAGLYMGTQWGICLEICR